MVIRALAIGQHYKATFGSMGNILNRQAGREVVSFDGTAIVSEAETYIEGAIHDLYFVDQLYASTALIKSIREKNPGKPIVAVCSSDYVEDVDRNISIFALSPEEIAKVLREYNLVEDDVKLN